MKILFFSAIQKFINDLQKNVQYLILGDKNQAVYDFKGADNRFLTLAKDIYPNSVVLPLSQSFRVTKPIANFVNFVLLGEYRIKTVKKGSNVNYLICNTFKIYKYLIIKIKEFFNAGYKPEDIFVLCPSFKSKKLNPVKLLENELTKSNIPCYISLDTKLDDNYIKNKVVFTTFHQSKGRERKIVIIYNFDSSYFDFYNKTAPKYKCPASFYVAITRASEHLSLIHHYENEYLPFLKANLLPQYVEYISNQRIQNRSKSEKIPEVSVTDLIKHLPQDVISECLKLIDRKQIKKRKTLIQINSKTEQKYGFENVGEITGTAIPSYYEFIKKNKMTMYETKLI
jgi:superfamily I DNA/RNA helicase